MSVIFSKQKKIEYDYSYFPTNFRRTNQLNTQRGSWVQQAGAGSCNFPTEIMGPQNYNFAL